jgi:scyllo-inositol 2-dehydrogenase (NADP+)
MPINTCIIGYGLSAKVFQIPYILETPGLHLHSILQRTPTADNAASRDYPAVKIHHDLSTVLSDPEIRLAIVTTSNASHYAITKALLLAGKDVVVEKPLTILTSEADELVALAKQTGRLLTAFHSSHPLAPFSPPPANPI